MYKKILVPLDGSASAEKALAHVYRLAECINAEIVLLHLAKRPVAANLADDISLTSTLLQTGEEEAERYVDDLLTHLPRMGVKVTARMASGPTAFAILAGAEHAHADLIAFPYRQANAVERWASGAVVRTVMRHAQVPVLLITPSC